jgi:hypothetical protein
MGLTKYTDRTTVRPGTDRGISTRMVITSYALDYLPPPWGWIHSARYVIFVVLLSTGHNKTFVRSLLGDVTIDILT